MGAITVIQPHILVFTHDDEVFEWLSFETQVRLDRFEPSLFIRAMVPAVGLFVLRHVPHIRVVVVDQVADCGHPTYRKLHLIRDINVVTARRFPVITVGEFEPHSFLQSGATHESRRDDLPILLAELFHEEYERWRQPRSPTPPTHQLRRSEGSRRKRQPT